MRNIRVFNDFKRAKEDFKSIVPGHVGMYVCGPTVYGMPHVGHAKSYISFDIVYRYLKYIGYQVKYVQNITDIGHLVGDADEGEDKIQKQARIEKLDPVAIAYNYENEFFKAMDKLNICRPSISCRATGHIIEIQQMVETLIDKGYAYVTDEGNVYFDVHKYPAYGQLSGRTLDDTVSGERIVVADDKKNPEDFALWKFADPTHIMKWPSPWGMGYPGWHIECSVMSKKYLGDTFDIHGGGMDNLFPHHECECAQSEVANGKPICNYFLHNNLVTVDGKKMGKSLGNFVTMENLFKQASPLAIRFYILQTHYRRPTDFVVARIKEAEESYNQISAVCDKARKKVEIPAGAEIETEAVAAIKEKFLEAMDDDFNTSLAISYIFELVKTINTALAADDKAVLRDAVIFVDECVNPILGLPFVSEAAAGGDDALDASLIDMILAIRTDAKKNKNYALSDQIRDNLSAIGVTVRDTKNGPEYEINR